MVSRYLVGLSLRRRGWGLRFGLVGSDEGAGERAAEAGDGVGDADPVGQRVGQVVGQFGQVLVGVGAGDLDGGVVEAGRGQLLPILVDGSHS